MANDISTSEFVKNPAAALGLLVLGGFLIAFRKTIESVLLTNTINYIWLPVLSIAAIVVAFSVYSKRGIGKNFFVLSALVVGLWMIVFPSFAQEFGKIFLLLFGDIFKAAEAGTHLFVGRIVIFIIIGLLIFFMAVRYKNKQ
jgi:hypothetical protein